MKAAEKKLEQGALETDKKWSLPRVENKTVDTSEGMAAWSMRKVLEKHEAIRQEVMGGVVPEWWSRAKRDAEEEGNKARATGQESEWCRNLEN